MWQKLKSAEQNAVDTQSLTGDKIQGMTYYPKSLEWGYLPFSKCRVTKQQFWGANNQLTTIPADKIQREAIDLFSNAFISPVFQPIDFKPYAQKMINEGSIVLDTEKGHFYRWNTQRMSLDFSVEEGVEYFDCDNSHLWNSVKYIGRFWLEVSPFLYITKNTKLTLNVEKNTLLWNNLLYQCIFQIKNPYKLQSRNEDIIMDNCKWSTISEYTFTNYQSFFNGSSQQNYAYVNNMDYYTFEEFFGLSTRKGFNGFYFSTPSYERSSAPFFSIYRNVDAYANMNGNTYTEIPILTRKDSGINVRVYLTPALFMGIPALNVEPLIKTSEPIIAGCNARIIEKI